VNDALIASMEGAVAASPDDVALRVHLAQLLSDAERHADALAHAQHVLGLAPDHLEALRVAAGSARELGQLALADSYERLAAALDSSAPLAPAPDPASVDTPVRETPAGQWGPGSGEHGELDVDGFLDDVLGEVIDNYERSVVRLSDVAGMETVKRQIELSFLGPLRNPEMRKAYGASLRGGLLLYGPPGCGKTYIARAIAGELAAAFISVGLNDVLDMWLGNSERQLHELFELARRQAPAVLFFDEVDAIGVQRAAVRGGGAKNVVTQLLTELDGFDAANDGVFVLGATNQPWDVDSALRRPGRFDRTLLVLPPDRAAREMIFRGRLADLPTEDLDLAKIAARCEGYSGADVRLVCEAAGQLAMSEALERGAVVPVAQRHLERAVRDVKPSTGTWFDIARNAAHFANRDGQYDDLIAYLNKRR
jgi:SpoVK/Ycf46/Vps4 family AAA+-type ATPase